MLNYTPHKSLDYVDRVNRAIDLVRQNLDQPLKLESVSRAACFSPFHFHRIFRSLVGESLNQFVKRLRLERALGLIWQANWAGQRRLSLTDIAFACGFASSSDFARCFKQCFGAAASSFDLAAFRSNRRKAWQSAVDDPKKRHILRRLRTTKSPDCFEVRVRQLPPRSVAYIRVHKPLRESACLSATTRLMRWAERQGLSGDQWLSCMWDKPDITAYHRWCYDIGLIVPENTPRGEVSRIDFPAMEVAEVEIRGGIEMEVRAMDWLAGTWLPANGFKPQNQPVFEAWRGRAFAQGTSHFEYLNQIPVARG